MQSIWRGTISFGLVSIPVRLYSATEEKSISFRQVHEADAGRIRYKRVCSVDGEEVPYSDIAKGYELPDGDMVVLTDEDFEQLPLKSTRTVDVLQFVPVEEVDPVSFDRAYLCDPSGGDAKPYVLLARCAGAHRQGGDRQGGAAAARAAGHAAPRDGVLVLQTLLWPDEIRDVQLRLPGRGHPHPAAGGRDGRVVHRRAVRATSSRSEYVDEYRVALEEVIEAKAAGREVVEVPAGAGGQRHGRRPDGGAAAKRRRRQGGPRRRQTPPRAAGEEDRGQEGSAATKKPGEEDGRQEGGRAGKPPRARRRPKASRPTKTASKTVTKTSQPDSEQDGAQVRLRACHTRRVMSSASPDPLPLWPVDTLDVAGAELAVRRAEPTGRDVEPALYVHGLGGSATNWTDLMGRLRDRVDGEALDLPGFGFSPAAEGWRLQPGGHARSVVSLLEYRDRGPVHLFGNSLGGAVATLVAARRPDLVRTLTLVSPAMPDLRPRRHTLPMALMWLPGFGEAAQRYLTGLPPERRMEGILELCFADPASVPERRRIEAIEEIRRRGPAMPVKRRWPRCAGW